MIRHLEYQENAFIDAELEGHVLQLNVADVDKVIETEFVVKANDQHGANVERVVKLTLNPLSQSGSARTVFGKQQGAGVHIVVLGDGYQQNEAGLFRDQVNDVVDLMREDPAIATHMSAIHIHAISQPSQDSGVDDFFNDDIRNTVFDAGYNCQAIERLICADELAMFSAALTEYPYVHQIILLVNDQRFGGSGGSVAIASGYYPEVSIHEMGHSIARLADEYVTNELEEQSAPPLSEGQYANVSSENDPNKVPWSNWIEDKSNYPTQPGQAGVGIFAGAHYTSTLNRATFDSRMRSNQRLFGPVNGEQWVLSLYRLVGAVQEFGPIRKEITISAGEAVDFYVVPLFEDIIQRVEWYLDGELIKHTKRETKISPVLSVGAHRLEVRVVDISGLVRSPKINPALFSWHWEVIVQ